MDTGDAHGPPVVVAARARCALLVAQLTGVSPTTDDTAWPLPPPALVGRINAPDKRDARVFLTSGLHDLAHLLSAAVEAGIRLPASPDVLDFGCGAGRLLRHVRPWASRVGAVDRHADALTWIAAHLPGVETEQTSGQPPLRWPDEDFDLVVSNSVFTHIPLHRQAAWLTELARLLRPDGVALITVLGDEHAGVLLSVAERRALERDGAFELGPEIDSATGAVEALAAVVQTPAACSDAFGRVFEVLLRRVAPGHQDALVLRRRH